MADTDLTDDDKIEIVEPEVVEKPRGHTSWPTRLLVIFNLLAVLGFGALLYLDLDKRQAWAKAVFLRDLATAGLPVDDKDTKLGTNPEAGTQARHDLDPPLIKQAYQSRGGKLSDKFMYVRENFKVHIRPADLDQEILAKHFSDAGAGSPVSTLQQEIKRLKDKLPGEIDAIAQSVASKAKDKSAAEKQELLRKILFPLCKEGWQVDELEQTIRAPRDEKQDQEFLAAAVKRRLWFDILQPMEVFRPTEKIDAAQIDKAMNDKNAVADPKSKKALVSRAAKLDEVSVDDLKQLFMKRCDDTLAGKDWIDERFIRDNAEKRRCVAFLLADVGQVEIPGADRAEENAQPVKAPAKKAAKAKADRDKAGEAKDEEDKKGADQVEPPVEAKPAPRQRQLAFPSMERRAEAVCGLSDYDQACEDLAIVTEILENQTAQAIRRDLGDYRYPVSRQGDAENGANAIGFITKYDMVLKRTQALAALVDRRERQYKELKDNYDESVKLLEARTGQEKETIEKLSEARAQTRQLARDLKSLQDQLFIAQVNLRGAHEYIQYLAERLAAVEKSTPKTKGGAGK